MTLLIIYSNSIVFLQAFVGHLDYAPNSQILKDMAQGPLKCTKSFNIYNVNGYKFHIIKHATRKAADNSRVCVKALMTFKTEMTSTVGLKIL